MNLSAHEIGLEALDSLQGIDTLCLFVGEDERPLRGAAGYVDWRLCGALSRILVQRFFTGAPGDQLLVPSEGRIPMGRIFVMGLGRRSGLAGDGLGHALQAAAKMLNKAGTQSVALEVPAAGMIEDAARAKAFEQRFLGELWAQRVAVLADKGLKPLVRSSGKP